MRMRRARGLLAVAVLLASLAPPTVSTAEDRAVGFGFNFAIGAGVGTAWSSSGASATASRPYMELANLELRLFPIDKFSIDLQWGLMQMIAVPVLYEGAAAYVQNTYFHFHFTSQRRAAFALAPCIQTAVAQVSGVPMGMVGVGSRVGVDLTSEGKSFGFGIYFRPAVQFGGAEAASGIAFEGVVELTWVWYAIKP